MTQRCDCCGLMVDRQAEDCPRCHYPVSPPKEVRFLEAALHDLQRVADQGGANISVLDLIHRYQGRLAYLLRASPIAAPSASIAPPAEKPAEAKWPLAPVVPITTGSEDDEFTESSLQPPALAVPPIAAAPVPPSPTPVQVPPESLPPRPSQPPVQRQAEAPVLQEDQAAPRLVFSLRSFFADQAINIIASLGAFLILAGSLSFIATTPNLWLSFLVVLIVHAIFGVTGFITYRIPTFRVVATIYTIIFALLVPLVGFSAYRLVTGNVITLSVPVLIAIAAIYAAVVYGVLALFQRFTPFAYLGVITLLVADLAVARAFDLGYWWWPSMSMLLACAALVSVPRPADSTWPFVGIWTILRQPTRLLMYGILAATAAGVLIITFYSFRLDSLGTLAREVRFSVFSMTLLLLLWGSLFLWLVKRTRGARELAYLFLLSVLALCYSFDLQPIGYALALTGVALLYHALNRFAGRFLTPLSRFSPDLDQLALALVLLVPFISSPLLPAQLFARVYGTSPGIGSLPPFVANWQTVAELLALGLGLLLTISVTLRRTGVQRTPANVAWCWLLLASGFLLTWGYSLIMLALHVVPAWSFLGLALALVAFAVFTRQRLASAWANPLDILALLEMILTLSLSQGQDTASSLLLFFAALTYAVLFYQRRQAWFFLPLVFALLALPLLLDRPLTMLLISLLLPLASVAIRRLPFHRLNAPPAPLQRLAGSEWPLLVAGLLYGIVFSIHDVLAPKSAIEGWSHLAFPAALEIALPSLAWYASAAFTRIKWWLVPAVGFALGALLLPANSFWVLAALTPIIAILGVGISRLAGRDWALPLYIVALFGAVMTGYSGLTQDHWTATAWIVLGFAALVYIIGVVDNLPLAMWAAPIFATGSVIVSASLLGDLYRPPTIALVCAALGVSLRWLHRLPAPFVNSVRSHISRLQTPSSHLLYALPFYATALAAALLTGIYGTLSNINSPFFSAIPDALLVYALVAFIVLLVEQQPRWLWLVAGFAIWGIALATQLTAYYVVGVGMGLGIVGLLVSRVIKRDVVVPTSMRPLIKCIWSWPWYSAALVAAVVTGLWTSLPFTPPFSEFSEYALLPFAVLAYLIGVADDIPAWSWVGSALAIWSLIYPTTQGRFYHLVTVALVCTAIAVGTGILNRVAPALFGNQGRNKRLLYALPLYLAGLVAAILTGIDGMIFWDKQLFYSAVPDVLVLYAAIACAISIYERRPIWLGVVAAFGVWATLLAMQLTSYYVVGIGLGAAIAGLGLSQIARFPGYRWETVTASRLFKLTWGWPWYVTMLASAVVTGVWAVLPLKQPIAGYIEYSLLGFAVLSYIIGGVEDVPAWLWFGPAFATGSLLYSQGDVYRPVAVALVCCTAVLAIRLLDRLAPARLSGRRLQYALPFYATALIAAVLTGMHGMLFTINDPFYSAIPDALLVYALLAFVVSVFERRPVGLWLVAGFAIWSTSLAVQLTAYYITAVGIGAGIVGLAAGRLIPQPPANGGKLPYMQVLIKFAWNWPWYLTALLAAVFIGAWPSLPALQPGTGFIGYSLLALTVLAFSIMLVERVPEVLVLPVGLTVWATQQWQPSFSITSLMIAYSLLCVLTFATQFLWRMVSPTTRWIPATMLHTVLGLGGQSLVVLAIISQHGLSADSGLLAQVGVGALLVLALLVFAFGRLHPGDVARLSASEGAEAKREARLRRARRVQQWCTYGAGLLLSLVVSWELSALRQTMLDVLVLAPASYFIVIAPFLTRNETVAERRWIGQVIAIVGAALLLLPTLWLSFSDANLFPTLILLGESLAMLLLGITTRVRIFVLSSASLIIVGGLHTLFLPSLGITPSLALTLLGIILLAIATGFTLARRRLQSAWTHWE